MTAELPDEGPPLITMDELVELSIASLKRGAVEVSSRPIRRARIPVSRCAELLSIDSSGRQPSRWSPRGPARSSRPPICTLFYVTVAARISFTLCQNRARSNVFDAAGHGASYNKSGEHGMQYMLLVYWNEAEQVSATKEQKAETFAAYSAYSEAMKKAGVFLSASGLQDSSEPA